MPPLASSYIIIGAGVFGASTALALSREKLAPTVILIDRAPFPCPIAASHDINKIVRSDYGDIFYCKLGLQALERWREDPLYMQWYHQSGLAKATDERFGRVQKIFDNYKELGVDVKAELFSPKEMKTRFGGLYTDGDFTDVDDVLWNPSSGWAEAARALKATIEAAVDNGVHYVSAPVAKLTLKDGCCTGIQTEDGRTFTASKVVLSTGAYTAKLLADSAPTQPELQVGDRITACAVCEAAVSLTPEQAETFQDAPAFVLDAGKVQGEAMPPTPQRQLKFIRDVPFRNTVYHPASDQSLSVPLTSTERSLWTSPENMPSGIRREVDTVLNGVYGTKVKGLRPDVYRFCWDGITQDNNWYICPHPHCQNLYIATAGSFHGWKFLPIIGQYVVEMLKGELSEEMTRRWEWDRSFEGYPKNILLPERELRDLED
ncbi:MAG: hypothetical protein ASARMPREDX12_006334 [Alectoria sarmentosa]|nr:MAG: hypothetical protein ASARMPREDX12_006334 [Alectoria sarmentosa]